MPGFITIRIMVNGIDPIRQGITVGSPDDQADKYSKKQGKQTDPRNPAHVLALNLFRVPLLIFLEPKD